MKDIKIDLQATAQLLRVLAEPTRVRLLRLLEREELTVAELAAATRLAQPRVSTHLARLRELDLVRDRRAGVSAYYRFNDDGLANDALSLWRSVRESAEDPQFREDSQALKQVLSERAREQNWADAVAGDMERHYSPGRTWEATARALMKLMDLGDVLDMASGDGVLAELLTDQARSITCLDVSERVVTAARSRLASHANIGVHQGDMHDLPFDDQSFDLVLMLHALTYTERPGLVVQQAARVLRPGGRLLAVTLRKHEHTSAIAPFNHRNQGFTPAQLKRLCTQAGLDVTTCEVTSREARAPHFEVITLVASKAS